MLRPIDLYNLNTGCGPKVELFVPCVRIGVLGVWDYHPHLKQTHVAPGTMNCGLSIHTQLYKNLHIYDEWFLFSKTGVV